MFLNFEKNRLKKYAVPTLFKDCTAPNVLQNCKGNDIATESINTKCLNKSDLVIVCSMINVARISDDTPISSGSVQEEVPNSVQQTQGNKTWLA
jgi:hypothetical protein